MKLLTSGDLSVAGLIHVDAFLVGGDVGNQDMDVNELVQTIYYSRPGGVGGSGVVVIRDAR
jgi:hypothetical protein